MDTLHSIPAFRSRLPYRFLFVVMAGLIGGSPAVLAQTAKYEEKMAEGRRQMTMDSFLEAYNSFEAARVFAARPYDETHMLEAITYRENALSGLGDHIRNLKNIETFDFPKQYRRAEAQRLALLALREAERPTTTDALPLLLLARRMAVDDPDMDTGSFHQIMGTILYRQFGALLPGSAAGLTQARFSPDSREIFTISRDRTLRRWTIEGIPVGQPCRHDGYIRSAVFSRKGDRILTAGTDQKLYSWDAVRDVPPRVWNGHSDEVNQALFLDDTTQVLSAGRDGTLRRWDLSAQSSVTLLTLSAPIQEIAAYSADVVLARGAGNEAVVWTPEMNYTLAHRGYIYSAVFSPDGQRVLTASADSTARLWNWRQNTSVTLDRHHGLVTRAYFNHHGDRLVTTATDGTAILWTSAGDTIRTLTGHRGWVLDAAFSADDRLLFTRDEGASLRVWDADGRPVATLEGHTDDLLAAAFSPATLDKTYLLTASRDGAAKLWDERGNLLMNLDGFGSAVVTASFSPNGQYILAAAENGAAVVCPLPEAILPDLERRLLISPEQIKRYGMDSWPAFLTPYLESAADKP